MNDEVIYGYNEDCIKDVSFYDIIQSLSIEDDLKEEPKPNDLIALYPDILED